MTKFIVDEEMSKKIFKELPPEEEQHLREYIRLFQVAIKDTQPGVGYFLHLLNVSLGQNYDADKFPVEKLDVVRKHVICNFIANLMDDYFIHENDLKTVRDGKKDLADKLETGESQVEDF